jgi:hypothetical protein
LIDVPLLSLKGGRKGSWWEFWLLLLLLQRGKHTVSGMI